MAYSVTLESYKGPLDVLLEMITDKKLEINQVALGEVTEQYLQYVEAHDLPARELADFLSVAARLLHIKTKALLPYLYEETEKEEVSLEQQLKIYKVYWDAAKDVDALYRSSTRLFAKSKSTFADEPVFSPPSKKQVAPSVLKDLFFMIINGLEQVVDLPKTSIKKTVSLAQKISILKDMLRTAKKISFRTFVYGGSSTTDVIVNFLAVLEMIKQREIDVAGSGNELVLEKL